MYVRTTNALWWYLGRALKFVVSCPPPARADTLSSTGAQELGWMALYVLLFPLPSFPLCRRRGQGDLLILRPTYA